jgi:hypothetical protein
VRKRVRGGERGRGRVRKRVRGGERGRGRGIERDKKMIWMIPKKLVRNPERYLLLYLPHPGYSSVGMVPRGELSQERLIERERERERGRGRKRSAWFLKKLKRIQKDNCFFICCTRL